MSNSPLANRASAEAALVAQINAAAARLDAVGTSALDAALERLKASADAARDRLATAYSKVQWCASDVVEHLTSMTGALAQQLATPAAAQPVPAQPVEAPSLAEPPAPVVAPSAPAAPASTTCPGCGFAPRRGESFCRTCKVAVEAPVPPPVIDMTQPITAVLAQVVAPHPNDTPRTVTAEDVANGTAFDVPAAGEPKRKRSRKPDRDLNGTTP